MARTVSIGAQGFAEMRERNYFLVDKTDFVRDWWQGGDVVTLICRPRRFGKTLNLDMVECFLSTRYERRADLFEGLDVWSSMAMRQDQGRWPVVSISFASVKGGSFDALRARLCSIIAQVYRDHAKDIELDALDSYERSLFVGESLSVSVDRLPDSLTRLCEILYRQTGRHVIVLIDEYDTPLQEAWVDGCWDDMLELVRPLFNATLKSNPYLERGLVTGITRVARESIFSDLNNLRVVTSTSNAYETAFGFTQDEVDAALGEFGLNDLQGVKTWYDGFKFGSAEDVYNPWSITNYLKERTLSAYWANSSSNSLVSTLISRSDGQLKATFETLLDGDTITETIEEQISFPDLDYDPNALWSLLVASGYLKIVGIRDRVENVCDLQVTNYETMLSFDAMVRRWFARARFAYNGFVRALLAGDLESMNAYMNDVALDTFSMFDAGARPATTAPERFYHGFVLGLLVDLRGRYQVRSNRESGYGRYDVMLVPAKAKDDPGIIIEFKVRRPSEASLEETVTSALEQIEARRYRTELTAAGVPEGHVRAYGFAFEGKHVLIGAR